MDGERPSALPVEPSISTQIRNFASVWESYVSNGTLDVSPGIFWSGLIVNVCGCDVQALQMNS